MLETIEKHYNKNRLKEKTTSELVLTNKVLTLQNKEQKKRINELVLASQEKDKCINELVLANQEKDKLAKKLVRANQEESERANKLMLANQLIIANEELDFLRGLYKK